jgi:hypothetical protein
MKTTDVINLAKSEEKLKVNRNGGSHYALRKQAVRLADKNVIKLVEITSKCFIYEAV